jgi:opacity protein-like surface antigen
MILKIVHTLLVCTLVQIGSVFFASTASAQSQNGQPRTTSELGIGIGGVVYKGEVAPRYRLANNRPALTIFYKKDLSKALVGRVGLLVGRVKATDPEVPAGEGSGLARDLPLGIYRQAEMTTSLLELSAGIDYNFLDYYDFRRNVRWTPYFTLGVAGLVYNNKTTAQNLDIIYPPGSGKDQAYRTAFALAVPVGAGIKYALSEHWNLGLEAGVRVLFTDEFDNLSSQNEQVMNKYLNDLYFYNGISISYTFYKVNCPVGPSINSRVR